MEIPWVLFKYRDWENPYHRRMLTDFEVFLSAPNTLNDPLDCAIPLTYLGKNNEDYWKNTYPSLEEMRKNWGIFSLSADHINPLLWSHYANGHRGICIGFWVSTLLSSLEISTVWQVKYRKSIPIITPSSGSVPNLITLQLSTKSRVWSYEREWRCIANEFPSCKDPLNISIEERTAKISPLSIRYLIFGLAMHPEIKQSIMKLVRSNPELQHVEVYEVTTRKSKFDLTLVRYDSAGTRDSLSKVLALSNKFQNRHYRRRVGKLPK